MQGMEFHEKLQELRKRKGLTQEELAQSLYVSRTAVSKWESGRGYPNIGSLKDIAAFFAVTVDQLLSTDEVLTVAEEDRRRKETHDRALVYGLLDLSMALLFFLPFFGGLRSETHTKTHTEPCAFGLPGLLAAFFGSKIIFGKVCRGFSSPVL